MRNIVVGVFYPGMKEFCQDYVKSINSQSVLNFELLLFNNGFENIDKVVNQFTRKIPIKVINIKDEFSEATERRKFILNILKKENNVQNIIFTDADDFFDSNRIEYMIKGLQSAKIVFIDIVPVDKEGKRMAKKSFLSEIKDIDLNRVKFKDLTDKNILGFSNTGIQRDCLDKIFPYTNNLKVGDWWFFTSILAHGITASLVKGPLLYYRQHDTNIAGIKKVFTPTDVQFAIEVKIAEYEDMIGHLNGDKKNSIMMELKNIRIVQKLVSSDQGMSAYLHHINNLNRTFCWWEHVHKKFIPQDLELKSSQTPEN